jgi:NodT family efflux transporter outer membrane factor (OMF) lipoprotein
MKRFFCHVALSLMAGCAAGPDYRRPSAPVADRFKEMPGPWRQAQPRDEVERGRWWEMFGDAELNGLIDRIDSSNQTLLASEARYRQALAAIGVARAGLFPQIEADVSIQRSHSPSGAVGGTTAGRTITQRTASVNANWEIDLWQRVRRLVEASGASAQAGAGDVASVRLLLQAQLAANYFQLRVLDAQKRLLDDTVDAYRRSFELTGNRYNAGVAGKVDVVQADAQLKSTLALAMDLGVQRAQLENSIAVLTGTPPSAFAIAPRPTLTAQLPVIPPGLPSTLLERRPDVAAAERRVAAANAQIGVARAAYFPQLTLSATGGYRSSEASTWFLSPTRFWSIGPTIAQAIFDAGLREAQTAQAIAFYDATVADYRQTALVAFQETEDNLAALRILEDEAALQNEAVQAARESLTLTSNQYRAGTVSYLNVVTVQATALGNERAALDIINRRLLASVLLVKALGGGWRPAPCEDPALPCIAR